MITYFVLWCYLLIQGMAHNTGVLPLAKGRALQRPRGTLSYFEERTTFETRASASLTTSGGISLVPLVGLKWGAG
jgi:hypothetical protein